MKEDAPCPPSPPRKRRILEDESQTLDAWLAVWANDEQLAPSQRRRAQDERDRRKAARPVELVVGFSGSREGMSPEQRRRVKSMLIDLEPVEAHHGDCVGADEQFHSLCRGLKIPIVLHPSDLKGTRAFCNGAIRTERTKPPLERNKDIVRESSVLVATPKEGREPEPGPGQGTWSTVRYGRKRGGNVKVVMIDGSIQGEE